MHAQAVLDALPFGVLVTDHQLRLLQINHWLVERLPDPPPDLIGMPLAQAFPELAERSLLAAYELVQHQGRALDLPTQIHRYFLRLPAPAGSGLPEMAQTAIIIPLFDAGCYSGALTLIQDASQQSVIERQLRREIDKLTALHEIDRVLATLDLKTCLQTIVERTRTLFGAVNAALLLREGDWQQVVADAGYEPTVVGARIPLAQGLSGWSARQREAALVPDVAQDPRYLGIDARARSEMVAPLLLPDDCIGVINVESHILNAFTDADLEMLELLAARAAAAINNARLHEAERDHRRLADTLRDIGLMLSTELDPAAILDTLLDHVARVVPYDSASVMLLDPAGQRVRVASWRGYDRFGIASLIPAYESDFLSISNLAQMAATRQPNFVTDVRHDPNWVQTDVSRHIGSWAGAPIMARGRILGFLSLDKVEAGFYTREMAAGLAVFAAEAGLALENARLYAEQQRLAVTDGLTGIANRRHFDSELVRELQRAARFRRSTVLLLLDLDDFKRYNDAYGHPAGDDLLRALAILFNQSLRSVDTAARYGGEEFAIILPETNLDAGSATGERLRELVQHLPLSPAAPGGLPAAPVTISLGLAMAPAHAATAAELVRAADTALYQAKARGKNRLVVAHAAFGDIDGYNASHESSSDV